jgi:hypothetical protein
MDWTEVAHQLPPEGILVETKIVEPAAEREQRPLLWHRTIWWTPNYATMAIDAPTHWRPIETVETEKPPTELI